MHDIKLSNSSKTIKFDTISYVNLIVTISQVFSLSDFEISHVENEVFSLIRSDEDLQKLLSENPKRLSIVVVKSASVVSQEEESKVIKIISSEKYKKNPNIPRKSTGEYFPKEKMKFIGETGYTSLNNQEVRASRITRTFRIQNNGKVEWPEGSMIIPTRLTKSHHVHFKTKSMCFPIPCKVQPNQFVDITIPIFVPVACDCYSASWKLVTPLYSIGPTFGLSINVIDFPNVK